GHDRNLTNLVEVPAWFSPTPDSIWVSALDDKERFTISSFPAARGQAAYCRIEEWEPGTLSWEMDLSTGKNLFRVEGPSFQTHGGSVAENEVAAFFASWEPRWNAAAGRVLMPYDGGASKDGRDDFSRTLPYKQVKAGARGTFEQVRVEGVPVGPSGPAQA